MSFLHQRLISGVCRACRLKRWISGPPTRTCMTIEQPLNRITTPVNHPHSNDKMILTQTCCCYLHCTITVPSLYHHCTICTRYIDLYNWVKTQPKFLERKPRLWTSNEQAGVEVCMIQLSLAVVRHSPVVPLEVLNVLHNVKHCRQRSFQQCVRCCRKTRIQRQHSSPHNHLLDVAHRRTEILTSTPHFSTVLDDAWHNRFT